MNKEDLIGWAMLVLLAAFVLYFLVWKEFKEKRLKNKVLNEALSGNQYALRILKQKIWIDLKDKKLINEALKGNPAALKILDIEDNKKY